MGTVLCVLEDSGRDRSSSRLLLAYAASSSLCNLTDTQHYSSGPQDSEIKQKTNRASPLGQRPVVLYLLGPGALVLLSPASGAEALPDGVTVETASSLTHQVRLLDAEAPAHHLRVHPALKQIIFSRLHTDLSVSAVKAFRGRCHL